MRFHKNLYLCTGILMISCDFWISCNRSGRPKNRPFSNYVDSRERFHWFYGEALSSSASPILQRGRAAVARWAHNSKVTGSNPVLAT